MPHDDRPATQAELESFMHGTCRELNVRPGHPHMRAPQNDIDAKFIAFSLYAGGLRNKDKSHFSSREAIQDRKERDTTVENRRRSPRTEQV